MSHQEILEKILFEKKTSKRELAKMIGYTSQNTKKHFNKPTYTEKMIEKISTALGIEPSVFTNTLVNGDNHGTVTQTINADERATYEERLRDKEAIIAYQKSRIAELERILNN